MSFKKNVTVVMDMGGTYLKFGIMDDAYDLLYHDQIDARSDLERESLLENICIPVARCLSESQAQGYNVTSLAISTPGPFDYIQGKSFMKGKYDSIYDVALRDEIYSRCNVKDRFPIHFMQDATAYGVGEYVVGAARGVENFCCVTLGTGVGFSIRKDGEQLKNERGGSYFPLGFQEYNGIKLDDLVSGRAIKNRFGKSAKELKELADAGDEDAKRIFHECAVILGECVCRVDVIDRMQLLVVGGQVSNSFEYWENGIREGLIKCGVDLKIERSSSPEFSALYGAMYLSKNMKNG